MYSLAAAIPKWEELPDRVFQAGGRDNITSIVIRMQHVGNHEPPAHILAEKKPFANDVLASVAGLPYPDTLKETTYTEDGSTRYLVPPAEFRFSPGAIPGMKRATIPALCISENPVTNQRYVDFLNKNMDKPMNRPPDKYTLRGINQVVKWGRPL